MKKHFLITAMIATTFAFTAAYADKNPQTIDAKTSEMMKKFEAAATPGEPHKMLGEMAGTWQYTSKMWEKPDSTPQEAKGKSKFKKILGGRWVQQDFKGTAMGQKFEGMGFVGYNNVKDKYESIWMDTMSTAAMKGEGTMDQASKTIKESGTFSCPISGDKTQEYRNEWQMVDKKKMVFTMYGKGPTDGPEYKMMEITYTR